jgi:hypothetical protein
VCGSRLPPCTPPCPRRKLGGQGCIEFAVGNGGYLSGNDRTLLAGASAASFYFALWAVLALTDDRPTLPPVIDPRHTGLLVDGRARSLSFRVYLFVFGPRDTHILVRPRLT